MKADTTGTLFFKEDVKNVFVKWEKADGSQQDQKLSESDLSDSIRKMARDKKDGLEVEVKLKSGNPGKVWPKGENQQAFDQGPHNPTRSQNSFVYPYNFVRIDPTGQRVEKEKPAPHHRFDTDRFHGKMTIRLTPLSPLFIPKSAPEKEENEHRWYKFHRNEFGDPSIPTTSLKGMLRSAFESLTESCFAVFSFGQDDYINYRFNPKRPKHIDFASSFLPARIEKGKLVPMNPLTAWVSKGAYPKKKTGDSVQFTYVTQSTVNDPRKYRLDADNRVVRKRGRNDLGLMADGSGKEKGYLKKSWVVQSKKNPPKGAHRHERIFVPDGSPGQPLSDEAINGYKRLIKETKEQTKNNDSDYRAIPSREEIQEFGDETLVYFGENPFNGKLQLSRTSIPKVSPYRSILDLLPKNYRPCNNHKKLCPACRVFGMVNKKGKGAYKGNVRISPSKWHSENQKWEADYTELKILSNPHPESTNFYLVDDKHKNTEEVCYDHDDALLRGRKRYWQRAENNKSDHEMPRFHPYKGDKQNIDAEVMEKEAGHFTFDIHFENLSRWELGALLFTLELPWTKDAKGNHQIGRGKSIGLGRCEISITDIKLLDPQKRYAALDETGGWNTLNIQTDEKEKFIDAYKTRMVGLFGKDKSFDALAPIADLKLLTSPQTWSIRYPEFDDIQLKDKSKEKVIKDKMGKVTFGWFGGGEPNRRDTPLPLPEKTGEQQWDGDNPHPVKK